MRPIATSRFGALCSALLLMAALSRPLIEPAAAATMMPSGFSEYVVASQLVMPTAFDFAPDGRLFVAEKRGIVKEFDSIDDTTPTVFADLRTEVHNAYDRGLLDIAVDPQFPERPYVYVFYAADAPIDGTAPTYGTPDADADTCPAGAECVASTRVSRLTAHDNGLAEETVLTADSCTEFPIHDGGGLAVGEDGALYASFGDGSWVGDDYGWHGAN